ncbi:MAG: tRNA lysidine(34) synthetase TilS [Clostridium sp.]|nr:tRNA lysidine(34) synthetase TilS [Clostridium sp.]
MRRHGMLRPGDRVVAGVSGGADSVCLLFVLLEWAKKYPLELAVAHVNHGLRREAEQDALFVEGLCRAQGLPFYLEEADVKGAAKQRKLSEEEAGRLIRQEVFERVAEKTGASKVAVAHNAGDQAETMLFHLFRGSGLGGLAGIRPVRTWRSGRQILRPLLCLERGEIEAYLRERGIAYRTDATNRTDAYTRNRIRRHILPYAEEAVARGCVSHMAQTADILAETEDFLEMQTGRAYERCVVCEKAGNRDGGCQNPAAQQTRLRIRIADFSSLHPAIGKRLLFAMVKALAPGQKDITYRHVSSLLPLFQEAGNRVICLPHGIRCRRQYEEVILEDAFPLQLPGNIPYSQSSISKNYVFGEITLPDFPVNGKFPENCKARMRAYGCCPAAFAEHVRLTLLNDDAFSKKDKEIPEKQYTKSFDYDKIKKPLMLRTRQTGDYFLIKSLNPSGTSRKTIKEYMIGEKIPAGERDRVPLLAEENHILWVVGYRVSEYYKITGDTRRILRVEFRQ